jgi:glycosyltransferase involved in cell wall biosynthesis
MATHLPRITLVTPSFQQGRFLADTIESVLDQHYPNLQYIIVDGGSRDESVSVIQRYASHLDWWVSEPDQGQTDALRKGFARADGVLLNWLNSDDLLRPGALHAVAEAWLASGADLIVGEDLPFTDDPAKPVGHFRPSGHHWPECLRFWTDEFRYHQPCTFFSARAWSASGGLDASLHYVMDYDLYCRILALPDCRVELLKRPLSAFRLHAEAKTSAQRPLFLQEQTLVSRRYWQGGGLDRAQAERELRAYTARCRFHQGVDALRQRHLREGLLQWIQGFSAAPVTFLRHAASRLNGSAGGAA